MLDEREFLSPYATLLFERGRYPEAISHFLEVLADEHGSVRNYVVSIGVPNALLLHLESALLTSP
jgi:hypothetical protein